MYNSSRRKHIVNGFTIYTCADSKSNQPDFQGQANSRELFPVTLKLTRRRFSPDKASVTSMRITKKLIPTIQLTHVVLLVVLFVPDVANFADA